MGCGNSSTAADSSSSSTKKGTIWTDLKQKLPLDRTPAEEKKRESLFQKFDVKKNKSLSEQECLEGCQTHLELQKLTTNLPAINKRAFHSSCKLRTKADATSDVDAAEFRLYLVYLRDYFELYVMFDEVDTSADKKVSKEEFKKALPKIEKWGVVVKDADAKYAEIDKDGKGIDFDEFAEWAIKQNLDAERDSNLDKGAKEQPKASGEQASGVAAASAPKAEEPKAAEKPKDEVKKPENESKANAPAPAGVSAAEKPKAAEEPKAAEKPKDEVKKPENESKANAPAPAGVSAAEKPKAAEEPKAAEKPKAAEEPKAAEKPKDEVKKPEKESKANAPAGVSAADRARIWAEVQGKLPRLKNKEQNAKRNALFKEFDPNGNGFLSLAEVDGGCRSILKLNELTDDLSEIVKRAFNEAKTAGDRAGLKSANPDFVQRVEFRLFLVYIYDYFEMWVMFDQLDSSADNKVSIGEFKAAIPKIAEWGLVVKDIEGTFKQIDKAGEGTISFDEFCDWAIAMHLDADGDINNEEE